MAYQSGFVEDLVRVRNKVIPPAGTAFGQKTTYEDAGEVWCKVSFVRGMKALNEGALDNYNTVMIRMRYLDNIDIVHRDSIFVYDGISYQVKSYFAHRRTDTIQITATEIVSKPSANL
jgi:hypothetical protein